MEYDAIMNMAEDKFHHQCFIIDFIISENYITMGAVLNYTSRGTHGKLIKSSKGKVDD